MYNIVLITVYRIENETFAFSILDRHKHMNERIFQKPKAWWFYMYVYCVSLGLALRKKICHTVRFGRAQVQSHHTLCSVCLYHVVDGCEFKGKIQKKNLYIQILIWLWKYFYTLMLLCIHFHAAVKKNRNNSTVNKKYQIVYRKLHISNRANKYKIIKKKSFHFCVCCLISFSKTFVTIFPNSYVRIDADRVVLIPKNNLSKTIMHSNAKRMEFN